MRILVASTGAVQRPGGEPALVDPAAQRTGNGRAGQVPLPGGGTHDACTSSGCSAATLLGTYPNRQAREPPQCSAGIDLLKTLPASAQQRDPHPPRDRRLHARSSMTPRLVRALGGQVAGEDRGSRRRG